MHRRVDAIANFASKSRASKVKDSSKFKEILKEGRFYMGQEAVKNGLIDEITTPEEYFARHFKGEPFKI
jgi:ClpP class serine protease